MITINIMTSGLSYTVGLSEAQWNTLSMALGEAERIRRYDADQNDEEGDAAQARLDREMADDFGDLWKKLFDPLQPLSDRA